ncbi:MAG: VWA domain-containing protein [Myxococcales bacterium]|nr:VWA domain-containing protein [Myxococcales bacterium]
MEPPRLSPVELLPPKVDQSVTQRVEIRDPKRIDATQVDVHKQSDGIVDILWVLDDSGSMKNQRAQLLGNFDRFLQELLKLNVDFQMGVTSTNATDGGRLRGATKIIKNTTPDPRSVFQANATFPDSRTRWEQGLRMAEFAVTKPNIDVGGPNEGFLRPKAALAIIAVSDEDDSSYGETAYYARALRSTKGKGNEGLVSFSVIGGTTPSGCFPPGEQIYFGGLAEPAFRYSQVAQKTGGVIGSICDASFETTLVRIAQALNTLRRVFPLSLKPLPETLSVQVNGVAVPKDVVNGWQLWEETSSSGLLSYSVVFLGNFIPPPGAIVRIEYAFLKT